MLKNVRKMFINRKHAMLDNHYMSTIRGVLLKQSFANKKVASFCTTIVVMKYPPDLFYNIRKRYLFWYKWNVADMCFISFCLNIDVVDSKMLL